MNRDSKVIVTGGAGFIGSHLVPELLSRNYRVLVIDNLHSGRQDNVPPEAEFLYLDLGRAEEFSIFEILHDFRPDTIIHLAGMHYIPACIANPAETFLANVRSTELLTRALSRLSIHKLIAASSADVYSALDKEHPESEPAAPVNVYGLSKVLMEDMLVSAARADPGRSSVALRLFNVYGPRDANPHVIPHIIKLLRSHSSELRMGATETTRDFVHVDDVVRAICSALEHETAKYDVFNVGTGQATPVREIVRILQQAAGERRTIVQDRSLMRHYDRPSLTADISKISQHLNWRPTVTIEDGLTRLLSEAMATS